MVALKMPSSDEPTVTMTIEIPAQGYIAIEADKGRYRRQAFDDMLAILLDRPAGVPG